MNVCVCECVCVCVCVCLCVFVYMFMLSSSTAAEFSKSFWKIKAHMHPVSSFSLSELHFSCLSCQT